MHICDGGNYSVRTSLKGKSLYIMEHNAVDPLYSGHLIKGVASFHGVKFY